MALKGSKLYIGGDFTYVNSVSQPHLAVVDTANNNPIDFGPTANNTVWALKIINNKLYVGGAFNQIGDSVSPYQARVDLATNKIDNWNAHVNANVYTIAGDASSVLIGGDFNIINTVPRSQMAAIDLNTNALTPFNPRILYISGLIKTIYPWGNEIFAGGSFYYNPKYRAGEYHNLIALDTSLGNITRYFDYTPHYSVEALAITNNKLFVAGQFNNLYDSVQQNVVIRNNLITYNLTDNHLTSDKYEPNNTVNGLFIDRKGGLIATGNFTLTNFVNRSFVAALSLITGQPTSWSVQPDYYVNSIALKDTTLFIGGWFNSISAPNYAVYASRRNLGAVSTRTGIPTSWNADADVTVQSMAIQDSTLYVGGYFTHIKGLPRTHVVAIGTGGSGVVQAWAPNPNKVVTAIQPFTDKIYLGGQFTLIKGATCKYFASINKADGTLNSWNPNPDNYVNAFNVSGNDIYMGGVFSTISSHKRQSVAAYNIFTDSLTSFNPILKTHSGKPPFLNGLALYGKTLFIGSEGGNSSLDSIADIQRHILGAVDTTAYNATPFNPIPDYTINTLKVVTNRLFIGGNYKSLENNPSSAYFSVFNLEPLTQASNLTFTSLQPNSVTANWINGSGEGRIVVVKEGSKPNAPADGSGYNANAVFGQGSNVNENYVVYKDSGSSVNVINLLPNHTYYFAVYEYNGSNSGTEYLQTPSLTGSITTPCPAYTNIVSPASPVTFCQGGSAVLTAIDSMSSYKWNTNDTTQSITIIASGSYTVAIADSNACNATSQPVLASYNSCGKPAGVAANTITATSATLRWKSVPCATKYNVQYRRDGTVAWTIESTSDTTITITGLSPNTTYNARIQTVCTSGKSDYTAINNFTTAASLLADATNSKMEEAEANSAVVYPNPASNKAIVEFNATKSGAYTLQIADATGKVLMTKHDVSIAGKNIILIDVKHFAQGMYIVSITDENGKQTIKLNKE